MDFQRRPEHALRPWLALLGRALLAAIFVLSGLNKTLNWSQTVQSMANQGVPIPSFLIFPAIAIELIGGLFLILGYRTRSAAFVLFLFLLPTTFFFHGFWALIDPERQMQFVNFMKNLAIMGGLLLTTAAGAGALSIDSRLEQRRARDALADKDRIRLVS